MTTTHIWQDGLLDIVLYFRSFKYILTIKKTQSITCIQFRNQTTIKVPLKTQGWGIVSSLPLLPPGKKQLLTLSAIALGLDLHIFKSAVTPLVRRLTGISPDYLWFGVHQRRGQSLTFSIRLSSMFSAQSLTLFRPRNLQVLRLSNSAFLRALLLHPLM